MQGSFRRKGLADHRCSVLLADDHAVVRAGIMLLIELTDRYEVVGEADTGEAVVEQVAELEPDLVIMDIRMPGMDGIAATRRIAKRHLDVRVLVLTAYDDLEYVEVAIETGAMGCLSKQRARSDLVAALDTLASEGCRFRNLSPGCCRKRGPRRAGSGPVDRDPIGLMVSLRRNVTERIVRSRTGATAMLDDMDRVLTCVCAWLENPER